jgi:hypothetical protein
LKVRDGLGRIQGSVADYYFDMEESWKDQKCKDVRFPVHNQYQESPVKVYHISELNKN